MSSRRALRFGAAFRRSVDRLGIERGSPRAKALLGLLALLAEQELPGPQDTRATIPPTKVCFVRRVPSQNLWAWYAIDEAHVTVITAHPPVPIE